MGVSEGIRISLRSALLRISSVFTISLTSFCFDNFFVTSLSSTSQDFKTLAKCLKSSAECFKGFTACFETNVLRSLLINGNIKSFLKSSL